MNSTRLNIAIEVDDKGTVKIRQLGKTAEKAGARAEKGFKRAGRTLGDFNQRATSAVGSIKALYAAIAGATAVVALTKISAASIKAASDLQEVSSKFDVVFSGQKQQAEAWSKTLVDSYAMSTRESKQYLSSVQDLLVPMGMAAKQAGQMSMEVVKLSADLGSFNNLPTSQVMDDIQSALVGNYETMKKYGVTLNATTVQQKALDMGLAATAKELTAAEKAQAAFKLITEGSSAAIGDMGRTAGSYANQLKKMHSRVEEIKVAIGQGLLPAMTDILADFNDWYRANGDLLRQDITKYVTTLTSETVKLVNELTPVATSIWDIGVAVQHLLSEYGGMSIGDTGIIGYMLFGKSGAGKVIVGLGVLTNSLMDTARGFEAVNNGQLSFSKFARMNHHELHAWLADLDKSTNSTISLDDALAGLSARFHDATGQTAAEVQALDDFYTVTNAAGPAAKKTAKVVCEAHKKQLTCAQKATVKAVEYDIKYHKERYRNTDMFVGKIEADKRATEMIKAQERATNEAINADLETAMNERDDLYGLHAEKVNQLQQNMVNDLGRIFDSYISDVLHGQIDSVGDLFKGLFDSILDMFMRMVAQFAANSLVDLIFGNGASGGTTLGSALSSLFGGSGSGGGLGLAYNGASVANTVSGWLGGPSTSSITAPISQYASGQLGLGSGTLGTNLMTGAHALYGAATTGVGSISSWYAGLQAAANGVNAGTSLALIEGSYGPAAEVVGTQIGATAGEEMAATLANTTVDFSIDAAGGYAASTGGSAASTGAGAGTAGWASAGWVALPLIGGSIWMGLENATDDKPAEQARKNWGLDTGISRDNLLAEEAIGTLSKKWTEQFEHVFDFATQGFGNLADMSHQLGAAMDVQHVQQYVSTLAGVNVSMEQSTQVMALAHEAAQGNEAAFNQLYETLNGMMQATGDSTEYASASAYGLVQAMIDAGQATDATIAELNGITQEMIDQQAAADALAETMVATGIATEDTAEQIAEAYGAGSEAIEHYIAQMSGLDEEWLSSADIMNDVRAAASGGAGALQTLINDLEGTGLSSTQAAQAAQAMTDAVRRFSATNLDLEATARLNVEVQGAANITSSVVGNVNTSSRYFDPYDPYGDAEGSALGGVVERPTWFSPFNYAGEAGPEAITPLRHPKQINHIEDKVDRLLAEAGNRPMVIHLHNYVAGQKVEEIILPVVDRHIDSRERSGISGRAVYAAG